MKELLILSLVFNIFISYMLYDVKQCSERKSETIEQLLDRIYLPYLSLR